MTVIDQIASRHRELSDAELISGVRGGDVSAYGDLFARHREAATRLARQLVPGPDADDLVSEAFAKVLNVLLAGGGPDVAFRAYLLTAVRRLHVDKIRATNRATPTDDLTPYETVEPQTDTVIAGFEGGAAAKAFASLPERWQLVLWHLEVEGQKPADIAPLLGMTANSVSALAYRAREGLRQAYLQMHTADLVDPDCRWTHAKLGAYVRKGLSRRDVQKVEDHLDGCRKCTAMYLELNEVNSSLAALLGPIVLGGAAAGYLTTTGSAGAAAGGVLAVLDRAKDVVLANMQTVAAVGAAAGVAGVATVAVAVSGGGSHTPTASPPRPSVTGPLSTPSTQTPAPHHRKKHPKAARTTAPVVTIPTATPSEVTPSQAPSNKPVEHKPAKPPVTKPTTVVLPPVSSTTSDVSVRLTFSVRVGPLTRQADGLLGYLNAGVSGVPSGQKATLTVHVVGGRLVSRGPGCHASGSSATCDIGPGTAPLEFNVIGIPVSATATVAVPSGYTDPVMANNNDSVLLGLIRVGSLRK
ncbi:MAG: sigma-70 family RNA polymerase sigma factor [Propionibacteriales bacterium]|nr:sigma-70 family RNA polymerase sigma factor [Propionibacteriales bacterium]